LPTQTLVSVPALCSFEHKGRSYVRGEMVDVTAVDALALARAKKVTLSRPQFMRSFGRYLRRDMRAAK
jgi:hypothetical protein